MCWKAAFRPGAVETGWLNRALAGLAGEGRAAPQGNKAFAVGPVTPLVVRGPGAGAGDVMVAATHRAGERRHADAAP